MIINDKSNCPNFKTCSLVNGTAIIQDENRKNMYINTFCTEGQAWSKCKRYLTKKDFNFCPDFVLPDSPGSPSDFIAEFDKNLLC